LKGFFFHEKRKHRILITCVKPPINYNLFSEVFTFLVAKKQRATMDANPSLWNRSAKNIIVEFKNIFYTYMNVGHIRWPIVPLMGITSCTWMKIVAQISINPKKAQQATYNVRRIKNSIYQLLLCNKTKLASKFYVLSIPAPTFNYPQNGWLGERKSTFKPKSYCRNPSLGLATKARGCKVAGQVERPGSIPHAPGSAKSVRE
jgi:hypothetical protein